MTGPARPETLAEVRVYAVPGGARDVSDAPGRLRIGRVWFGGWQVHPVPTTAYAQDAYLVRAHVDLMVQPGLAGPVWAEAGFTFPDPGVTVLDAVPRTVREPEPRRAYALTPLLNFVPAGDVPAGGPVAAAGPQEPFVGTFGIGTAAVRWRWTATGPRGVDPGSRDGWFVLLVPPGARTVRVRAVAGFGLPGDDARDLRSGHEPQECEVRLRPAESEPSPEEETVSGADVVVLTALPEEADAVVAALGACTERRWRDVVLHEGAVAGRRVLVVPIGGMGNAGAAQAAQQAVDVWNPARLVLTGIVGGIPAGGDDLRLGDVLVPDQVVGYEPGKLTAGGEQRRYDVHRPDAGLLAAARAMPAREWVHTVTVPRPDGTDGRELPRVHIGPVLSGEKVIADAGALPGVAAAWPKAVGVEMESFGVALAAYRGGPAFLMVKAVSDLRDAAKDDRWRRYACDVAARFVVALLARSPVAGAPGRPQSVPAGEPARFSGAAKLDVCRRLDNWRDLADVFEVPDWEIARFPHGEQARALWAWLEARGKLAALPAALDDIGRPDLAGRLRADAARPVR